jgi:prepilin-type processing-associated H-X9-DG protein
MRAADESYTYYGWLFDAWDVPLVPLAPLATVVNPLLKPNEQLKPTDQGPGQFVFWAAALISGCKPYLDANDPVGLARHADSDINLAALPGGIGAGYGTSGGNVIYRLREGIERFLVTDINDPASTARAQSDVFVMWDMLSTNPKDFNHVPGGSNVLYMDGHVEFVRFPGKQPVNSAVALLAGALTGAGN